MEIFLFCLLVGFCILFPGPVIALASIAMVGLIVICLFLVTFILVGALV